MYPTALLRLKVGKMPSLFRVRTEAYACPYFDGIILADYRCLHSSIDWMLMKVSRA